MWPWSGDCCDSMPCGSGTKVPNQSWSGLRHQINHHRKASSCDGGLENKERRTKDPDLEGSKMQEETLLTRPKLSPKRKSWAAGCRCD